MDAAKRVFYARELLDNPLWQEVFEALREESRSRWEGTDPEDTSTRELAWHETKALDRVKNEFEQQLQEATEETES